jgi:hypothetical protein
MPKKISYFVVLPQDYLIHPETGEIVGVCLEEEIDIAEAKRRYPEALGLKRLLKKGRSSERP